MDWQLEILMVIRTLLAALLGAFIGWERERHGQDAGVRTYAAVALGASSFGLISMHATVGNQMDTRVAAQVVSGIGFIGAGLIMREQGHATGLTTAATLWTTAAVGLSMAFGMYIVSILTAVITFSILWAHHLPGWKKIVATTHDHKEEGDVVQDAAKD
jgi:putative Mg2+ transporter-C (MgtC) family protein